MDNFEFARKTHYYFGFGQDDNIGTIVRDGGYHKVLLVYGQNYAIQSGLIDRIEHKLKECEISTLRHGGVRPNPRIDLVYSGIDMARAHNVDLILAVGGGSAIDTAKAIALGFYHEGDVFDFFLNQEKTGKVLDVGVVLTLPSSGSESSNSCVIQKQIGENVYKISYADDNLTPVFAVLNPELTFTLSAYLTGCGACDMFCHILERYFTNTYDVSITDRMCEAVLLSIIETAPRILKEPYNYEARANLMWAGSMAHNNICGVGRAQDWSCHNLEHQVSALFDVPHGAGLAVIFPCWMEYVMQHNIMRFAQFASRVFAIDMDFEHPEKTAKKGIEALKSFFIKLGMPQSLSQMGITGSDIPRFLSSLDIDHKRQGSFVTLHRTDCEAIYKMALSPEA